MTLHPAEPLTEILEKDWQATVVDLARQLGWVVYHTYNSRRSAHGFPDLVLVRDRVVYLELKREDRTTSKLTSQQCAWLRRLTDAGAEVYVARPSHLEELAHVLSTRVLATRPQMKSPTLNHELTRELEKEQAA